MSKGIGKISRARLAKVIAVSKGTITPKVVASSLSVTQQEAGRLLSRWCVSGWLKRVRRGFYVSIPIEAAPEKYAIENPWSVIAKIYEPGYVGGFSAIKHWDLSEQIFETVVFLTTKKVKDRSPVLSGIRVHLKTIASRKLFGLKTTWFGSAKIFVSDPSRTIVDLLDEPRLGGGISPVCDFFESYLESSHKNLDLLIEYAEKMENQTIFKRMGFLLELLSPTELAQLKKIESKISKGHSQLDSDLRCSKVVSRWNLKVPESWWRRYDRKK